MPFTTPLALLGLLFVPAVIAMYLLKLRRDEAVVPSTLLWSRLVADVEANAPWQRLRRSLLLLLQLLLVIILALLAARPFLERPAGLARDIVLVVDTSASMGATDVVPDRLTAAKAAAIEALRDLPTGGKVSVIAADRSGPHRGQRVDATSAGSARRSSGSTVSPQPRRPRRRARARLEARGTLRRRAGPGRHRRRPRHARHGAGRRAGHGPAGRPRAQEPGDRRARRPDGAVRRSRARCSSASPTSTSSSRSRRLELWGDDRLLEVRDVTLEPQSRADVIIDDLPRRRRRRSRCASWRATRPRPVRPTSSPSTTGRGPSCRPNRTAPDPRRRRRRPVPRDRPRLPAERRAVRGHARRVRAGDRAHGRTPMRPHHLRGLPAGRRCPGRRSWPSLRRGRARSARSTGTLTDPGIGSLDPDEPILRYVDLSTTHIAEAAQADPARLGADRSSRARRARRSCTPATRAGLPTAVLAFEPRQSDLPLQVAFPILLANLTGELLGGSSAPTEALEPGDAGRARHPGRAPAA